MSSYCSCQETKIICVDNLGFFILGFFSCFMWLNMLFLQVSILEYLA